MAFFLIIVRTGVAVVEAVPMESLMERFGERADSGRLDDGTCRHALPPAAAMRLVKEHDADIAGAVLDVGLLSCPHLPRPRLGARHSAAGGSGGGPRRRRYCGEWRGSGDDLQDDLELNAAASEEDEEEDAV